jgi:myo-inositol-1(or 4)-monophosphatase
MIPAAERQELCRLAGDIAQAAGARIRSLTPQQRHIEFKGLRDMVTEVDQAAEELILARLGDAVPDHSVIAEESGGIAQDHSDYRWYVDPLDGTTNFVHGFPAYCVSLACSYRGSLVASAIYDPVRDELFQAWLEGGARLNGRNIQVSSVDELGHSLLATGFPYVNDEFFSVNMRLWTGIYGRTQGLRRAGAAALDLAYVAAGRLDGFWEYQLQPWDQAAGTLLVTEAGGVVSRIDGGSFKPEDRTILAANPDLHSSLLAAIQDCLV